VLVPERVEAAVLIELEFFVYLGDSTPAVGRLDLDTVGVGADRQRRAPARRGGDAPQVVEDIAETA
jgi:hypothetical protein